MPADTGYKASLDQAALGAQHYLYLTAVPSGAAGNLVGMRLIDAGALTVAGVYKCGLNLSGLATAAYLHLKATISAGTATSAAVTTYKDGATTYQSFTGTGAMTTTVLQDASLATLKGEQAGVVSITLASSPNVTFTMAEYNGT